MADQDNIPAFPRHPQSGISWNPACDGMSLRDWFAGQALVGLLAHSFNDGSDFLHDIGPDAAAHQAYRMAGAMLAARKAGA